MVKFTDQAADAGLESAALAEAPELLRAAFLALASKIQSCDETHPKWALGRRGGKVAAAELQSLQTSVLHVWFLSASGTYKALAQQARDVTYFIQDLQDRIEYRRLQSTIAPRIKILGRQFRRLQALRCPWSRSRVDKVMRDIRAVSEETRRLGSLLDKAQAQSPDLLLPPPHSVRTTHQTVVFGRDKDRDDIVKLLLQHPGEDAPKPEMMVISVIGARGVGKTTLAQMVFNDATVGQHFDVKFWVSASPSCNKTDLTAEILRSAQPAWDESDEKKKKKTVDFQMLQSELRRLVASKRCLVVLDDVRDITDEVLLEILAPLQSADIRRSRVLVTSRTPHMPGASQLYAASPLGSGDSWSLLKEHAVNPSDAEDVHPDLEHIGRKIAAKCNGSPLSLKLVGGVLGATRSREHWMNVLETGLQDDTALLMSYKHLPGRLKRCFAYCSLFPEDYKFDPAHLSRLWIAEGFVEPQGGRADSRMEDIAREYFDQLLSRSFFQEIKLGKKVYYVVHGLLHDLAKSVSAEDCFRIEDGMNCDIPSSVRHLSVTINSLPSLADFSGVENLRTLLIQRSVPTSSSCFQEDIAVNLKCLLEKSKHLRVLDLSGLNLEELPQCIDGLLGLRYLSVHGSIQRLPESIGKLLHLQTLCFTGKCSLDKLPASISMLVNLRHLLVESKYTAGLVGIGRLTNLQGSLELHVEKREGLKVEELRHINGLRGLLKIKGLENVSSYEEACKAELNKKPYLHSLNLEWSSASRNNSLPADAKVLEGLQPHQDIKVLNIRRYCGAEAPNWLQSLQQLHSLHLTNCRSLAMLPALGHLGALKYLHMKEMCAVDLIGDEFYGSGDVAFPSLRFLEVDDFPRLHGWSGIADRVSFPCLERLIIRDCPELVKIPTSFPATREVTIERTRLIPYMRLAPFSSISEKSQLDLFTTSVDFNRLLSKQHIEAIAALNVSGAEEVIATEEIRSLVSLKRMQLSRCNITDQNFSKFLQVLPCLSSLEITDLPNLTSLPASETLRFSTMLTELSIRNCQLFQSLSSLQFFGSLKYLLIERCPKVTATSFPLNFRSGLSSLKVLRISYCSELQSLPACGLPPSLETLHIIGCHQELSRQSRNSKGNYFEKLAVVPNVWIQ